MPNRLFPLIRPVYEDEPELELVSTEARNNAELNAALERQIAFESEVIDQLRSHALSDAQIEKLENSLAKDGAQAAPPPIVPPPASGQIAAAIGSAAVAQTVTQPEPEPVASPKDKEKAEPNRKPGEDEEEEPRARRIMILFAISAGIITTICLLSYLGWDNIKSIPATDRTTILLHSPNGRAERKFDATR